MISLQIIITSSIRQILTLFFTSFFSRVFGIITQQDIDDNFITFLIIFIFSYIVATFSVFSIRYQIWQYNIEFYIYTDYYTFRQRKIMFIKRILIILSLIFTKLIITFFIISIVSSIKTNGGIRMLSLSEIFINNNIYKILIVISICFFILDTITYFAIRRGKYFTNSVPYPDINPEPDNYTLPNIETEFNKSATYIFI